MLDALAASGVSFRQTHIMGSLVGAVCVPSRACLHTGANVFRASLRPRVDDTPGAMTLNPALATLPATLRQAGYHTHAIGKWHNDKRGFAAGFSGGVCSRSTKTCSGWSARGGGSSSATTGRRHRGPGRRASSCST